MRGLFPVKNGFRMCLEISLAMWSLGSFSNEQTACFQPFDCDRLTMI